MRIYICKVSQRKVVDKLIYICYTLGKFVYIHISLVYQTIPIMENKKFYSTKEVLKKVGVSRNTLFLWLKKGKIPEVARDRNGHRLFAASDIKNILKFKNKRVPPSAITFKKTIE